MDRSPLEPPKIGNVPIGTQPPAAPKQCPSRYDPLAPRPRPVDAAGNPIDPKDLPHAGPYHPPPRAKLTDLVDVAAGAIDETTGINLPIGDEDSGAYRFGRGASWISGPVGVGGKLLRKGGTKAVKEIAEEGGEKAAKEVVERPGRLPDAENPMITPPAPPPAPKKIVVTERELRNPGRNPDGTRRDIRETTREDRPDAGELRRKGDELYERRTSGLKNSPDVDLLKNKAEIVKQLLDILNHFGK